MAAQGAPLGDGTMSVVVDENSAIVDKSVFEQSTKLLTLLQSESKRLKDENATLHRQVTTRSRSSLDLLSEIHLSLLSDCQARTRVITSKEQHRHL